LNPTHEVQIVAPVLDGDVFVLWKDGANHAGGAVAKTWRCIENSAGELYSTPTICSLDGVNLSVIVGSSQGLYKIDCYPCGSFSPGSPRWPWPTFHHDAARTGCSVPPSGQPRSASIIGRVVNVNDNRGVNGTVELGYFQDENWVTETRFHLRDYPRFHDPQMIEFEANPVRTAMPSGWVGVLLNEGCFVISQIIPANEGGPDYWLRVHYSCWTADVIDVYVGPLSVGVNDVGDIWVNPTPPP
jgi:hypothetical protein